MARAAIICERKEAYQKLGPIDRGTAIRRLIPRAVAQFRAQMNISD